MKMLFDFFPIILFFIAYKFQDIYFATIVAMISTILQVFFSWIKKKKVEMMHIITLVMIIFLGGATIFLQNDIFIKWKVSVVNWLFSIILLGSHFVGEKTVIERLMEKSIELPKYVWNRLNVSWSGFFAFIGCLNIYVVYNYDTDTWVNFKLFGVLGITLVFVILQSIFMAKHIKK